MCCTPCSTSRSTRIWPPVRGVEGVGVSDDIAFEQGAVIEKALEGQRLEVQRLPVAGEEELGNAASDGGALLQAVAREAVGEIQVVAGRVAADDAAVVEAIHLVIPGPGAAQAQRLEG